MNSEGIKFAARVFLIGCGPTSLSALEALSEHFVVVGLARECPGDNPELDETIVRAKSLDVPVYLKPTLRRIDRLVSELKPDCVVVSSISRVLPQATLARCRFLNVHYAPLPRYRGLAAVNWTVINNEQFAGITIHTITPGLDAGNILFQEIVPICNDQTTVDIFRTLNEIQRNRLPAAVQNYLDGDPGLPQPENEATYCCSRNPEDGEIDWSKPAPEIYNLVRALVAPYPGAFTFYQGKRLVVWKAEIVENPPRFVGHVPGRVVVVSRPGGFVDVLAGEGVLRIREVQFPGEKPKRASEVLTSVRGTLGLRASDLLSRIERLEKLLIESKA